MSESRTTRESEADSIAAARSRWLVSSEQASKLSSDLFQPGSGYGDPDARLADEHRLRSTKDAERLFREYFDLNRQRIDSEMLKLQRSQRLATWASFAHHIPFHFLFQSSLRLFSTFRAIPRIDNRIRNDVNYILT